MKLVVLDSYAAVSNDLTLDGLNQFCDSLSVYDRTPPELTVERIGDAEMVIVNKTVLSKEVLSKCPNVKYIGLFATGYNIIDIDYARERGIVVSNAPAYSTAGVAQLTFALILQFYNMVDKHDRMVHEGQWQNCIDFCFYDRGISELQGKTIGIIGFGAIGKKVAQLANAFDMNVLVHSRTVYTEYTNVSFVSLDTLLQNSDIVSLHCPLFKETEKMINKQALDKMKSSSIIINTSRGGMVDEQALADALNSGKIKGAGIDVVSVEPILSGNPILTAKNCVITPHIAWAGKETRERLIGIVCENVKSFLDGKPKNNVAK